MSPRRPSRERSKAVERGKPEPPRCSECGREIVVGAAKLGVWLCEYCLVIADFDVRT
jgi:ribosomal protein L37AE/L43A